MSALQIPAGLFQRYCQNPADPATDAEIRQLFKIPSNRYYTVARWPEHVAGRLYVDETRTRVVPVHKISKSDVVA